MWGRQLYAATESHSHSVEKPHSKPLFVCMHGWTGMMLLFYLGFPQCGCGSEIVGVAVRGMCPLFRIGCVQSTLEVGVHGCSERGDGHV